MLKIWSMRPLAYMRGHYYIFLLPYCKRARLSQCCTASHCIGASCFCDGITLQKKNLKSKSMGRTCTRLHPPPVTPVHLSWRYSANSRIADSSNSMLHVALHQFSGMKSRLTKKLMLQEVSHDFQTSISKSAEIKDTFSYTFPVWR